MAQHDTNKSVRYAIETSCIPLLCGTKRNVRAAARALFRTYGITSYAILTERHRPLELFLTPYYVRRIPATCTSPSFLADAALRFFDGLAETALPVLIDCTDGSLLCDTPALREMLEARCFLSDLNGYGEIPPFCYLDPRKEP